MGIMKMAEAQKRRRERRAAREAVELQNASWGSFLIKVVSAAALVGVGILGIASGRRQAFFLIIAGIVTAGSAVAHYRRMRQT